MKIKNIKNLVLFNNRFFTHNFELEINPLQNGDSVLVRKMFHTHLLQLSVEKMTDVYIFLKDSLGNVIKINKSKISSKFAIFAVITDSKNKL